MNAPTLNRHAPPLWMTLVAAALVAALLLAAFVVTLTDHIRHSAEVRRLYGQPAAHAASARHAPAVAQVRVALQAPQTR